MAFVHVETLDVFLYGDFVGSIARHPHRSVYSFEYDPLWIRNGVSISPIFLPLKFGEQYFPDLSPEVYRRLPAAIADALPDRFGNRLIDEKLQSMGVRPDSVTALDRLVYTGDRAMGALEFRPAGSLGREPKGAIELAKMVGIARDALTGSIANDRESKSALRQLLSVGTSAGGARAKAVINIDPVTDEITSGQRPERGKCSWLLKFDGVGDDAGLGETRMYGRIEYAYSLMAKAAGMDMPETRLLTEGGRAHFMVRRFDRTSVSPQELPQKIHMQSLCAMGHIDYNMIHMNEYSDLFSVIRRLDLGENAETEAFRRMAFNHLAMNCDDHSKNFAFLMDNEGRWSLAPAYDITFAYNSHNPWLREHLMGVDGKFADVTEKDLLAFAKQYGVPYAKKTLKEVRNALERWTEFSARAGIPKEAADEIASRFCVAQKIACTPCTPNSVFLFQTR
ncbi:MAG: type II toxin-antitoxin system HipA family toxin [Clostridiales Family XIII bacterium]|jgi:serine/threonine-protein kinase HipA|nr:type II toxin-antitoxin system HipA family toxin [Clostridiales Family XIII bacterium]